MNILKTTTRKIILLIFVFVFSLNTLAFADSYNPSRKEVESIIDEVAQKRAIPSTLLKAIARVESVFEQFNSDGSPVICGSSIGLMQINNKYGGYDSEKLKYDIEYNIEAGADVLLNKWSMSSYQSVSSVGNMDPNILENWYFALWAYNGWAQSNNPNMSSYYAKSHTYQQLIYDVIDNEYGENVNNIDFSYLPTSGKPSRSLVVPTPTCTNSGDIVLYEKGDYVRTDGIRTSYQLRDVPAGKYIHELGVNQLGIITDGPVLQNGYYWYKVSVNDSTEGWIERNWLLRTGDVETGRYVFEDISFHWARKDIMKLFNKGIVSEATSFNPDSVATKEEFCILISKVLENTKYNNEEEKNVELPYIDKADIHPWAVEYIQNVYNLGLLDDYGNELKPLNEITRKEAATILNNIFQTNDEFENLDITTIFSDLGNLSENEKNAVKSAYTNGLINGRYSGVFCPDDYLTRAEASAIMVKIIDKLDQTEIESTN
ncbi:MAG: S-layer homology domain-containing protein [Sedimentibacter sp.]